MDRRKTYRAALCMEEITTNIIEHGFERENRRNTAEVRVIVSGDDLILRVRDNAGAQNNTVQNKAGVQCRLYSCNVKCLLQGPQVGAGRHYSTGRRSWRESSPSSCFNSLYT